MIPKKLDKKVYPPNWTIEIYLPVKPEYDLQDTKDEIYRRYNAYESDQQKIKDLLAACETAESRLTAINESLGDRRCNWTVGANNKTIIQLQTAIATAEKRD